MPAKKALEHAATVAQMGQEAGVLYKQQSTNEDIGKARLDKPENRGLEGKDVKQFAALWVHARRRLWR